MRELSAACDAPEPKAEIDLTPMLDVVFILLIFFLVVATFTKEHGLDVNRADALPDLPSDVKNVLISIEQDNLIRIDERLIDPRAVRANISRMIAGNSEANVVIQVDKDSANKTLVQVMDASRQAGAYEMSLATRN